VHVRTKRCLGGNVACNCAVAFREGNNVYGVYACDAGKSPLAIRYLVDPFTPAEITISPTGDKYTVRSAMTVEFSFYTSLTK